MYEVSVIENLNYNNIYEKVVGKKNFIKHVTTTLLTMLKLCHFLFEERVINI